MPRNAVHLGETGRGEQETCDGLTKRVVSVAWGGLAAVPSDPQKWNRYAYVGNRPLNATSSLGLDNGGGPDDPLQVLAIIVIGGPVTEPADLPEPHGTDVIYLQEPGGWKRIPSQVPTLDRGIYIYPDQDGRSCHQIDFTDASGVGTVVFVGDATQ